eukprot:9467880-Karenia_brevis.AAC.1
MLTLKSFGKEGTEAHQSLAWDPGGPHPSLMKDMATKATWDPGGLHPSLMKGMATKASLMKGMATKANVTTETELVGVPGEDGKPQVDLSRPAQGYGKNQRTWDPGGPHPRISDEKKTGYGNNA